MAITINQEPNNIAAVYGYLPYAVSSNRILNPQFQYVMDIKSGSNVLARIRQYPNPAGDAIFDPSQIMSDFLEYPTHNFDGGSQVEVPRQVQNFTIAFGEEYGNSISSSVALYDGNDVLGNPGVSGSNTPLIAIPTQVDYQGVDTSGWNFNATGSGKNFALGEWYSNYPSQSLNAANVDANTKRYIDFNDTGFLQIPISGSDTVGVDYKLFNSSNVQQGSTISKTVSPSDTCMVSSPIGPYQVGFSQTNWDNSSYMRIEGPNNNLYLYKDEETCYYDRFQIQFINRVGGLEWYGISLPTQQNSQVKRETYTKPFLPWSNTTAVYNQMTRGKEIYNVSKTDTISITTPYLDQAESQWLEQIYDSPAVWINPGPNKNFWKPVIVNTNRFVRNVNKRGQKLFQYTFEFEYSNVNAGR